VRVEFPFFPKGESRKHAWNPRRGKKIQMFKGNIKQKSKWGQSQWQ